MKCPKCSYLSFETAERCRNCGYDFSMSPPDDDPAGDLPLFDEAPLVSVPATPRAPLAVRRTGPRPQPGAQDPARLRSRQTPAAPKVDPPPSLDLEFEPQPVRQPPPPPVSQPAARAQPAAVNDGADASPVPHRLGAAAIDLFIAGGIDVVVIYFTLQLAGLDATELATLSLVPLATFLLLLNGGYSVVFTSVTGQTIGKMAMGLHVVGLDGAERITFGRATLRTAAYFASALPAGLGFIPALVGADRRALHDRLAGTRVVRL